MAQKTAQKKSPITSALADQDREITCKALEATLLDLIDLHLVAKQAHWNVVGRLFHDVHLHLDELVDTARGFADDVAERCVALGVPPDGRAQTVAQGSAVPRFEAGWRDDRAVVEAMTTDLSEIVRRVRERIDETDKTDLVTQDLFNTISRELEKSHWMWQAQLAE
jgi:starvation-inducible DNA-binding protein